MRSIRESLQCIQERFRYYIHITSGTGNHFLMGCIQSMIHLCGHCKSHESIRDVSPLGDEQSAHIPRKK